MILTGYGAYTIEDKINTTDYVYVKNTITLNGKAVTGPVLKSDLTRAGYNPNNYEPYNYVEKGTQKSTPHGVTDEDGCVVITIHFDNLKTYGTINVEVSKSGYTGMTTTAKVFA